MAKVEMTVNGRRSCAECEDRTLLVHFSAGESRPDRHACRLRHLAVRRLRRPCGRQGGEELHHAGGPGLRLDRDDDRGLADGGELHPVQAAFKEHHGLQCGFCTPGMIMTAVDMITPPWRPVSTRRPSAASWKAISAAAPAITTSSRRSLRRPSEMAMREGRRGIDARRIGSRLAAGRPSRGGATCGSRYAGSHGAPDSGGLTRWVLKVLARAWRARKTSGSSPARAAIPTT